MDGGETRPVQAGAEEGSFPRGTNQSGMRDHNERLVLSLVRRRGSLAKTDIARMTQLSVQTVSVIMRKLEDDGLLLGRSLFAVRSGSLPCPWRSIRTAPISSG